MISAQNCPVCQAPLKGDALTCPQCGAGVSICYPPPDAELPRQERARVLMEEAERCQAAGALECARQLAHEALTLRPDCPAIHSLLGCIQQQLGHDSAARLHFQAALAVTPPAETVPPQPAVRQAPNAWMAVIVFGCLLFSGLATLFVFLPSAQKTQQAALLVTQNNHPPQRTPTPWTWRIPAPRASRLDNPAPPVPVDMPVDTTKPAVNTTVTTHVPPPPPTGAVLGPVAHAHAVVAITEPTLDMAESAYFRGDFDEAATLYEALLRRSDASNPRIHQDLAWCYQQLGNSGKATQHLSEAVRGYQSILEHDPQNAAAQHGIAACQAALRAVREKHAATP
jgi:hypothetical protein